MLFLRMYFLSYGWKKLHFLRHSVGSTSVFYRTRESKVADSGLCNDTVIPY
jgi:hypothetical protein